MTQEEFIQKSIGIPWVKHAHSFESMDCYGLVMLYYKHVMGIDLGVMPIRDISEGGFEEESSNWHESLPAQAGLAFMSFKGGIPSHCGIVIDEWHVIHSGGNDKGYGSVKIDKIASLERLFGKMKFYAYSL
jgi:cell wall-associated NlpC family hydrolase